MQFIIVARAKGLGNSASVPVLGALGEQGWLFAELKAILNVYAV